MSQKFRHIIVSETNYEALKRRGKMQETFDDVVTQLLNATVNTNKEGEAHK
jgi:hypothetical protein